MNSSSIFSSRVSRSSSRSRARSLTVSGGSSPACSRRYMPTQFPRVPSLIPSSFATRAIGRDVSITILTASSLNSGEKLFFARGNYFTFPDVHPIGWTVRKPRGTSVLAALAGFVPAVVWELTGERRERNARAAEKRKAALRNFAPAVVPPDAGGAVAGSPGGHGAAWYLRPEAQVVAFRPRPELDQLREWCVAGGRLGVRLVTGEGGSGKTRLARRLAAGLSGHGWRTLWVERGQEQAAVGTVRDIGEPAVLVVDYAETRPGLAGLLAEAAAVEDCPDLRVVLLARSAGEWWRQLLAEADDRLSQAAGGRRAAGSGAGWRLRAASRRLFDDAVAAFAGELRATRPEARLMLDDPDAVVLVVHAAALLAVLDQAPVRAAGPVRVFGGWRAGGPAGARGPVLGARPRGPRAHP